MADQIVRMRCGPVHKRLFRLPAGASVEWQGLAPWITGSERVQDSAGKMVLAPIRCSEMDCRRQMRAVVIKGRYSDKVECGSKCVSAIGPACECKCRGENHGAN